MVLLVLSISSRSPGHSGSRHGPPLTYNALCADLGQPKEVLEEVHPKGALEDVQHNNILNEVPGEAYLKEVHLEKVELKEVLKDVLREIQLEEVNTKDILKESSRKYSRKYYWMYLGKDSRKYSGKGIYQQVCLSEQ